MSNAVIEVSNLSKQYTLGPRRRHGRTLRETITDTLLSKFQRNAEERQGETFWALKDVSFEVKKGEVVGLIGRNGAGKSTLLKVLSRIVEPTSGRVHLRGRVASLLEVGTGFHPELTGRENIFLNGAILGMKRSEIARKFDEIVAFAEIDKFLDTAVKRYSSGMYVRLAFAVAAHLEPEILIVDEVLAVGDAEFQRKCLGKMKDVASGEGRTVFFVSHNMQAVLALTSSAIRLEAGKVVSQGRTATVANEYLSALRKNGREMLNHQNTNGDGAFESVVIQENVNRETYEVTWGTPLAIDFAVRVKRPLSNADLTIAVQNAEGVTVFSHYRSDSHGIIPLLQEGLHHFRVQVPSNYLRPGSYWLHAALCRNRTENVAHLEALAMPRVLPNPVSDPGIESRRSGVALLPCRWESVTTA